MPTRMILAAVVAMLLAGCSAPQYADDVNFLERLRYTRDAQGNCFAYRQDLSQGVGTVYSFSIIPCDRMPLVAAPQSESDVELFLGGTRP